MERREVSDETRQYEEKRRQGIGVGREGRRRDEVNGLREEKICIEEII